jgi:hypothetical protein
MMSRKLLDGSTVDDSDISIELTIRTKCPEKWMLVDRETGEIYVPYTTPGPRQWKKIDYATWAPPEEIKDNA